MANNKNLSFKKIKKIYHEQVKEELPVVEVKVEQLEVLPELSHIVEHKPEPVKVIEGTEAAVDEFLAALGATNLVEVVTTAPTPKIDIPVSAFVDATQLDDFLKNIQEEAPTLIVEQPPTEVTPLTKQVIDLTKPVATSKKAKALIDPNIKAINDRLGLFERRLGDLAVRPMGQDPGGGETKFRFLDDVNRASINDNWVLEYDAETKKFQFTENVGPIRTVKFNTSGPQTSLVPGQVGWNADEDCLDVGQSDGSTLQVGLEQYIRVHNHIPSTLTSGTVVAFAGVENTNAVAMPIVAKYLADAEVNPLLIIGVLTTDIVTGGIGRATTFGYVRNINTTGSTVGETWVQGDLLWGHPTIAGGMTKVRPTAPNIATSIAAVVRVGTTDGQLLVRPTIIPRTSYGDWYDTTNQYAAEINTGYPIKMNSVGSVSGFQINAGGTEIKALNAGRYNFEFSLQVTSSRASTGRFYLWYRKNGVDVPNSATVMTIAANGGKLAPAWNFPVLMAVNDTFTLMWATDSTSVNLSAEPAAAFHPAIPSVILTVSHTNL